MCIRDRYSRVYMCFQMATNMTKHTHTHTHIIHTNTHSMSMRVFTWCTRQYEFTCVHVGDVMYFHVLSCMCLATWTTHVYMPKFLVCTHVYVHANGSGGPNRYLECIHKNTCVYIHTYPAYLACMPVYLHAWYLQCIHMYTCHCSVMYRHVNTCIICRTLYTCIHALS